MKMCRFKMIQFWFLSSLLVCAALVGEASGQNARTTITFDDGVDGAAITTIGTDPMYHYRDQVIYGAPVVADLSSVYAPAKIIRVYPASRWNNQDITPMFNLSNAHMDIWFGDPFDGGTRTTLRIGINGPSDLMADDPVDGYRFKPERMFVVGDRMVAYCSVFEVAVNRANKVGILSASMVDIQAGILDPWTVHFVTAQYSSLADRIGGLWAISVPVFYEGAYWSVVTDYDSRLYRGGQCWLLKMNTDGTPQGMVRMYTRSGATGEHWHGGAIVYDGSEYKVVWHVGDSSKRLFFRQTTLLSAYSTDALLDSGSGIGLLYQTQLAASDVWGPVVLAGGPDEDTLLENSRWKNAFVLGQDPNDESKFLYGGDVGAGLVERVSLDANGIAVCETVFNPMSRNIRQKSNEVSRQMSMFLVSSMGSSLVGIVSNEMDRGSNVPQYSGIIQSDDGGTTWGWVWRGDASVGLGQNSGIAILSNGRIIAGTQITATSVLGVLPGAKVTGKPLFVGYRPINILGNASEQSILDNGSGGGGGITSVGSSPEKPLPPVVHSEHVFDIARVEGFGENALLRLINGGIDQQVLAPVADAANMNVAFWIRRKTPSSSSEADRMQVDTRFGWATPGGDYGTGDRRYTPTTKTASGDWVRIIGQYDGANLSGIFSTNPGDLNTNVKAVSFVTSSGNSEVLFEYANIGHDRPALPYNTFDASGISSAKVTDLGLGETWTVLVAMEIPEETWDSWSGNESDTWEESVPVLTISDASDTNFATIQAMLTSSAQGGLGIGFIDASFNWEVSDSQSPIPSEVSEHPLRTTGVIMALSKDGVGKLQYAIAGPHGTTSGSRAMASVIHADTLRFSNINETDALEMYILQVQADCQAFTLAELEEMVSTLSFPEPIGGSCSCLADYTDDDILNFFDISAFLQAFNNNQPAADLNSDGIYNFFDVSIFLQAFAAGCP